MVYWNIGLSSLEPDVSLEPEVIVRTVSAQQSEGLVVMVTELKLEVEVLVETEVGAGRIHVVAGVVCGVGTELIPFEINLKPILERHTCGDIESVGRSALLFLASDRGRVLGTDSPVVTVEIQAGADTFALQVDTFTVDPVTLPTEYTNLQAFDRLQLDRSDDILLLVGVGKVDTLTVIDTELIVDEVVVVSADGQEITLDLQTKVTSTHVGLSQAVAHSGHLLYEEREITYSNVPGVHRVLECEGPLELSHLHGKSGVLGPLDVEILDVRSAAGSLELDTVLEIAENGTVDIESDQSAAKAGTSFGTFLVSVLVRTDDVTSEFGSALEACLLIAIFRLLFVLSENAKTEEKRGGSNQKLFHLQI